MMNTRWRRDPGVDELIRYFDHEKKKYKYGSLTTKDRRVIEDESAKCRGSFEYAARNYFWIVDKFNRDILFNLWPSQELILDRMHSLKAKGRAQKLMLLKARQLGCSTLIEAMIAWRTIFFSNMNALVVSVNEEKSTKLFAKMLHIYDRLPWWLQPMIAARKYEEGIWFDNPDGSSRRDFPGINSRVMVQHSTQMSGIGEGDTINAAHITEYSSWLEKIARQTIDGDLAYALVDSPETFAVLESTGKGSGGYSERLWNANIELGEQADWEPLFLPWFFEPTRIIAPPKGWKPDKKETAMRERVNDEWLKCKKCDAWREARRHKQGEKCIECGVGTLDPFVLADDQLAYIWQKRINHEKKGSDSVKELKQELATTAEDAFQLSGSPVFSEDALDWVQFCLRDPIGSGHLDDNGYFHAVKDRETKKCFQEWCNENHDYDVEKPLQVWELPRPGAEYVIGVDVARGIGADGDYSVAFVNRKGKGPNPDVQVAVFRSHDIDAYSFATPCCQLGYWYNTAMLSIEYNYPTTADTVRMNHQYPNLFRWKNYDAAAGRLESSKWHWQTQHNTKPKLVGTARRWLKARLWIIRSRNMHAELKHYQAGDSDDKKTEAARGKHDDEVMAGMISLYTSHDTDSTEGNPMEQRFASQSVVGAAWEMQCTRCSHRWGAKNPEREYGCPKCGNLLVNGERRTSNEPSKVVDFNDMLMTAGSLSERDMAETPFDNI
jgi:hypothetical protein